MHYRNMGEVPVTPAAAPQTVEQYAEYVVTQVVPLGATVADIPVTIDSDSDFIAVGLKGSSTGAYNIRYKDANGRYIQSAPVASVNAVGTAQFPVPIVPGLVVPAAGRILVDLTDTSGAANTVQLVFMGTRRFPVR